MSFSRILPGSRVFIATNVLIYHRSGKSPQCTDLLTQCADGNVTAFVSTVVLAEYSHRMMMIECYARGLTASNPAKAMSARPELVRSLVSYADDVRELLDGGLVIEPVVALDCHVALELQSRFGLLTNDSLNLAVARRLGISDLATADSNFDQVHGIVVHRPSDVG